MGPVCVESLTGRSGTGGPARIGIRWPLVGDQLVDERVFGCQQHRRRPVDRVGTGGEHLDGRAGGARVGVGREADVSALAAADPVALHDLDALEPVHPVEVGKQPVGVRRDAHHPLFHRAAEDRMVAPVGSPLVGDFLVGQHRSQRRAPVDRCFAQVGQAMLVELGAPLDVVHLGPRSTAGGGLLPSLEQLDQLSDRAGPLRIGVVPGIEDLQEDPLRPAVVLHIGRGQRSLVVVPESQSGQLARHIGNVPFGIDAGVLAGLAGMLLRRQPERVVAHRVQHHVAAHALETRIHVSADVAQRVPHMQARTRRVREHVHDEELVRAASRRVRRRLGGIGCAIRAVGLPPLLPAQLDLVRHLGVVAIRREFAPLS